MTSGYPGPGQDPYNPNPSDPFAQPGYGQMPTYPNPYGQPQQPQQPQQPTSGQPYTDPYSAPPYGQPQYQYAQPQYPPPAYPGGGYTVPAMPGGSPTQNNTLGLLAMIFGIVSIPLAFCCGILGIGLAGAGIVLGILGLRKANQGLATNRGMALTGIICGSVGVVGWIIVLAITAGSSFTHYGTP